LWWKIGWEDLTKIASKSLRLLQCFPSSFLDQQTFSISIFNKFSIFFYFDQIIKISPKLICIVARPNIGSNIEKKLKSLDYWVNSGSLTLNITYTHKQFILIFESQRKDHDPYK